MRSWGGIHRRYNKMKPINIKKFYSRSPFAAYSYGVARLFRPRRNDDALDLLKEYNNNPESRSSIEIVWNDEMDQIPDVKRIKNQYDGR